MGLIQFVHNYEDLSTDTGFQFEFFCDRCGSGYQTEFQGTPAGTVNDLLETAGNLFGGVFSAAAEIGERARSVGWKKMHDAEFRKAVEAAKPNFHQCNRCGHWVDTICWNQAQKLCKDCVPDLESEISVNETQAAIDHAAETAQEKSSAKPKKSKQIATATCSHCDAKLTGEKFCPECGTEVSQKTHCSDCGAEVSSKFCAECGTKQ